MRKIECSSKLEDLIRKCVEVGWKDPSFIKETLAKVLVAKNAFDDD